MIRSTLRPKPQPRPDRSAEFASWSPRPRPPAQMAQALHAEPPKPAAAKEQGRCDQRIRDAARGQPCTLQIDGICNGNPATSVWAHWPGIDAGRSMGLKGIDLAGAVACSSCHDVLDGRAPRPPGMTLEAVHLAFLRGHLRSLVMLARMGVVAQWERDA